MIYKNELVSYFHNSKAHVSNPYTETMQAIMSVDASKQAQKAMQQWPNYGATPLYSLAGLAQHLNIGKLYYKDESQRFDLKSVKSLGGSYAVAQQLLHIINEKTGEQASVIDLFSGKYNDLISQVTVATATDGNHGRSVAWGAQMFGCACVIYIHADVSVGREEAMQALGAEVIRIAGNYDDSVKLADEEAKANQWILVSDNSYEGYTEIPKDVALGYSVMLQEIVDQLGGDIPTHIFIQGGCGGLASAVCGFFWDYWQEARPRFVIVEPEQANCLQLSAQANELVVVDGKLETLMAGLACGEVSLIAWDILETGVDDFMTVSESLVPQSMKLLAQGQQSDTAIEAGESAVAGVAALLGVKDNDNVRQSLGLTAQSKVLVIGTEGATDPELYQQLISV